MIRNSYTSYLSKWNEQLEVKTIYSKIEFFECIVVTDCIRAYFVKGPKLIYISVNSRHRNLADTDNRPPVGPIFYYIYFAVQSRARVTLLLHDLVLSHVTFLTLS